MNLIYHDKRLLALLIGALIACILIAFFVLGGEMHVPFFHQLAWQSYGPIHSTAYSNWGPRPAIITWGS